MTQETEARGWEPETEYLFTGQEDFDQHYVTGRQLRQLPRYEYHEEEKAIYIDDPVWGREKIGEWEGDEVFCDLYTHPVFQRLAGIEQLTLPKQYATMPGSYDFTRWEHVWGSMVFVRKMIRQAEAEGQIFTPEEKRNLQLRTLLSDAGHTAFSHMRDWVRQGFGGAENSHDEELFEFLETHGVNDVLRWRGIAPRDVIFPPRQDWVECDPPKLCVDR